MVVPGASEKSYPRPDSCCRVWGERQCGFRVDSGPVEVGAIEPPVGGEGPETKIGEGNRVRAGVTYSPLLRRGTSEGRVSEFILRQAKSTSLGVGEAVVVAVEASATVGPAGQSARLELIGRGHQHEASSWRRVPVEAAEDQSARRSREGS